MTTSRGFSLIEILMVIGIIGIISTVVIANMTQARREGIDTANRENLATIAHQAELRHSTAGSYGTALAVTGSPIYSAPAYNASGANFIISDRQANDALRVAIRSAEAGYYAIGVGGQTWAVAVPLRASTGFWCIDAQGTGKVITTTGLGGGAAIARCP